MNEEKFKLGLVVDKLIWTYALYMLAGYGDIGIENWLSTGLRLTEE